MDLHEGEGFSIRLPKDYIVGDRDDLDILIDLGAKHSDGDNTFDPALYDEVKDKLYFWAAEIDLEQGDFFTNMFLVQENDLYGMSMNLVVGIMKSGIPAEDVISAEVVSLGVHEDVGRIVMVAEAEGETAGMAIHILEAQNATWMFIFTTSADILEEKLPEFDAIVSSFSVED
jgi:hypothetical protein